MAVICDVKSGSRVGSSSEQAPTHLIIIIGNVDIGIKESRAAMISTSLPISGVAKGGAKGAMAPPKYL